MAEIKWIKITVDMFDNEKIKLIEAMPDADSILIIWVKLLTYAGKINSSGYIMLTEKIPMNEEHLATIFNRPLNTIRYAIGVFEQFGMVEKEGGTLRITNWDIHQNVEGMQRIRDLNRRRKQRQRMREMPLPEPKKYEQISGMDAICSYCGVDNLSLTDFHVDHIVPLDKNGSNDMSNKTIACKSCNSTKSNKDLVDFLNDCLEYGSRMLNVSLILNNPKLMQHVKYIDGKFVTLLSRDSHGTDIDKNKSKNKSIDNTLSSDSTVYPYKEIIEYLNDKSDKQYKHTTKKTQTLIKARFNEGFELGDFKSVIDIKSKEWMNTEMEKYLRPETLFGTKFESYLNQSVESNQDNKKTGDNAIDYLDQL
jgi:predicted phage replisome organizer/uncharacterized phage protein (TIGR02220 family)